MRQTATQKKQPTNARPAAAPDSKRPQRQILPFVPPRWLRNPHLQSLLASLPMRRPFVLRRAQPLLKQSKMRIYTAQDGTKLLGELSVHHAEPPTEHNCEQTDAPLVVLLHGWEGSSRSLYLLSLAAELFNAGFHVLRLNLRDHGDSHHLNRHLFHACRIDEVVDAICAAAQDSPSDKLLLAGFSLGGNFVLRCAPHIERRRALHGLAAVCPVIHPASVMDALNYGPFIYRYYFEKKWRRSLLTKEQIFPDLFADSDWRSIKGIPKLTEHFITRHTEFDSAEQYFCGYRLVKEQLDQVQAEGLVLFAKDDPVIPQMDHTSLQLPDNLRLMISDSGGHCGFVDRLQQASWADRLIVQQFRQHLSDSAIEQ